MENENLNVSENSTLNICFAIARFIPLVGLAIADRKQITKLFVLYHWVSSSMIGVCIGVKIAMSRIVI